MRRRPRTSTIQSTGDRGTRSSCLRLPICMGHSAFRLGQDLVCPRSCVWQGEGEEDLLPIRMTLVPWGTGTGVQATRTRYTTRPPTWVTAEAQRSTWNSRSAFIWPGEGHRRGEPLLSGTTSCHHPASFGYSCSSLDHFPGFHSQHPRTVQPGLSPSSFCLG